MIQEILDLLKDFLAGKSTRFTEAQRKNQNIVHYINEIIRYWSKLNFIIKRTLIALKNAVPLAVTQNSLLLYLTYRKLFENESSDSIMEELINSKTGIIENSGKQEILNFLNKLDTFSWDLALKTKSAQEKLSIREAIPSFFIKKLEKEMDIQTIEENIRVMNDYKHVKYFTIHTNRDIGQIINTSEYVKDPEISNLYHIPIKSKSDFIKSELYSSRDIIILDKASATVVNLLFPGQNEFILDMCAAPGIKTSLISYYTKGRLYQIANDFSLERTKEMKTFTKQIENNKIHILNSDSISIPLRSSLKFDKVLLDAPCTGSGALLSNPELKWRQNEHFLHQNILLQEKLLKSAIKLLEHEGILVYSTCSLYPEEGEFQINKVIDKLEPMELPHWLGESYQIEGRNIPGTARLFPAQHNTEGFFIAKFKKK